MRNKLAQPEYLPELVENMEARCPCLLLLDCSGSMAGEPIRELNKGIKTYHEYLKQDSTASLSAETAVVTFGGNVDVAHEFATPDSLSIPELTAHGGTPMGKAISVGLDLLEQRKLDYKANGILYYRPIVLLLTDGAPTDSCEDVQKRIHSGGTVRKFSFFAVGVDGADMEFLKELAPPNRPPATLKEMRFHELFQWLSTSVTKLSHSKSSNEEIELDPIDSWGKL